jgi:hypothetical protein
VQVVDGIPTVKRWPGPADNFLLAVAEAAQVGAGDQGQERAAAARRHDNHDRSVLVETVLRKP